MLDMMGVMVASWAVSFWIGVVTVLALSLRWWKAKQKSNGFTSLVLPPSPSPGLPIIGHLHLMGGKTHPHRVLQELAERHGPLMMLRMGSVRLLVASSPEMAREILQRQDGVFASRPRMAASVHIAYNRSDTAFSPLGPLWRSMRMVCTTHLLTRKSIDGFWQAREQEIRAVMMSVMDAARSGTPVPVRPILWRCANNIICRMAFGFPVSDAAEAKGPRLSDVLEEVNVLFGVSNVGDFLPWLAWMDLQGYVKRMKSVASILSALFQRILDDARAARRRSPSPTSTSQDNSQPNLLDILLSLSETQKTLPGDIEITDTIIKALIQDMFAAGTDTWSLTVEWVLLELLNNPKTMQKLQGELYSVVGMERLVEEYDIPNLHYLQAVVKETLRLHPVAPLLLPHMTTKACQIGDYYIPSNTWTVVNAWAIQ